MSWPSALAGHAHCNDRLRIVIQDLQPIEPWNRNWRPMATRAARRGVVFSILAKSLLTTSRENNAQRADHRGKDKGPGASYALLAPVDEASNGELLVER